MAELFQESCVFCRIIRGEVSAAIVGETPEGIAFLDHKPLFPGHVLVAPREHVVTLGDLPPPLIAPLFSFAQRLSLAVERGLGAGGSFVAINNRVSQSVPHLHVHVIPRTKGDGMRGFFWPRQPYRDDAHTAETAARIRAALEKT
jgi:histidine triad (HIT) family protein